MKTIMKGVIRGQKGAAVLTLVLILLVLGGLILTPLLGLMGTGLMSGQVFEKNTDELYAADAGVEDAIWRIQTNNLTFDGNHSGPWYLTVNGKNVSVEVYEEDIDPTPCGTNFTYQILSTATTDDGGGIATHGSTTTIESYVTMTRPTTVVPFRFDSAIRSDTTLYSERATWVTSYPTPLAGNIVTNGTFTSTGNIYGNVTVPKVGDLQGKATIHGSVIYAPYSRPATPDISPYKTQAMAAENATPITPASSYNNVVTTINGDKRLSGNLTLASNKALTVNGDLYIEGYINLASGSTLTVNGALYVGSYINASATSKLSFGGTSYINGYMTLGKNNISEVSYVIIAKGNITFGAVDNGYYALIDGIIGKFNNGVLKGLTGNETAYITGPHSIVMSETGNITTIDTDEVAIGGFLYAPAGSITTHHWFRLIGAMFGNSVNIDDLRQIYAGIPAGSSGSGSGGSPGGLTILTWDIH
jgi:cytoskeletal protein CcmA (bactofilin family)